MKLRCYQGKCVEAILEAFKNGNSTMIVMPTGTGKSVVLAHVIRQMQPLRVLVFAHRDELIWQLKATIEAITGMPVEIEKAELRANTSLFHNCPVIVSSPQTQISGPKDKRRYMRFNPNDFGLIICDENHHSVSRSWKEIISYYQRNPNVKLLGCTATPDRTDNEALGQIFKTVAFKYDIVDAICEGFLTEISQQKISVKSLDLTGVRTTAGDYNEGDLSKILEMEENLHWICQATLECIFQLENHALDGIDVNDWPQFLASLNRVPRRTIVFTVSVAQAEMCAKIFSRAMKGVEWVCGKTNKDIRAKLLSKFMTGEIAVMVNVGVLTEGFDNPEVELIVMARPTKSRAYYAQCVGRALRPLKGLIDGLETAEQRIAAIKGSRKPFATVLDFVGNSDQHKLTISCANILGGKVSPDVIAKVKEEEIKANGKPVNILVTITAEQAALEKRQKEARELEQQREDERKRRLLFKSKFDVRQVNPFDQHSSLPTKSIATKDKKPISEKVERILKWKGIPVNKITAKDAGWLMGKLKANNWKVPADVQQWIKNLYRPTPQTISMEQQAKIDWDNYQASQVIA